MGGRRLVSSGVDGTARIFDLSTEKCIAVLEGHQGPVTGLSVTLAPPVKGVGLEKETEGDEGGGVKWKTRAAAGQGLTLATASRDGTARIWQLVDSESM